MEKEKNSNKLAYLIGNLKIDDPIGFECYLRGVWIDLIGRIPKNENDKINSKMRQGTLGITNFIFSKYYSLPGIIGDRLFRVFDYNNNGILDYNEFKIDMLTLFCKNYEATLRFIFDFYDFDSNGKISKEDIRIVFLYMAFSKGKNDENIEIQKKNEKK